MVISARVLSGLVVCLSVFLHLPGAGPQEAAASVSGDDSVLEASIQLHREDRHAEAEASLRAYLVDHPDQSRAHAYLGLTLLDLERWDEGEAELIRARNLDRPEPTLGEVGLGLGRVALKRGQSEQALNHLNQAARLDPGNAEVYRYRGLARSSQGDYPSALADLEKALQLDPTQAYGHYYAAMIYSRMRRTDKMVEHYQMFLRLAPNAPEAAKVQSLLRSVR